MGGSAAFFVLAPDGTVLGNSHAIAGENGRPLHQTGTTAAMKGSIGTAVRYSFFLNRDVVYVAVPVTDHGQIIGIVRTSDTTKPLSHVFEGSYLKFSIMVLLMLGAALEGQFSFQTVLVGRLMKSRTLPNDSPKGTLNTNSFLAGPKKLPNLHQRSII